MLTSVPDVLVKKQNIVNWSLNLYNWPFKKINNTFYNTKIICFSILNETLVSITHKNKSINTHIMVKWHGSTLLLWHQRKHSLCKGPPHANVTFYEFSWLLHGKVVATSNNTLPSHPLISLCFIWQSPWTHFFGPFKF
jgi:hypothetical protein